MGKDELALRFFVFGCMSTIVFKTIRTRKNIYFALTGSLLLLFLVLASTTWKSLQNENDYTKYAERISELEKEIQLLNQKNSVFDAAANIVSYIMGVMSPILTEWWGESIREARIKRKRKKCKIDSEFEIEKIKKQKRKKGKGKKNKREKYNGF